MASSTNNKTGKVFNLWSIWGWFDERPINLTRDEKDLAGAGLSGRAVSGNMSDYYYNSMDAGADLGAKFKNAREMGRHEIVSPIIEIYAEEASQEDPSNGKIVWATSDDEDVEDIINDLFERIGVDDNLFGTFHALAEGGNEFWRVLIGRGEDGKERIIGVTPIFVDEIRRVYDEASRRLLGFIWNEHDPADGVGVQIGEQRIFAPWDFIHFRRLLNRAGQSGEYGVGIVEPLFALYRRIKLSIDQMVMYRMAVMPTRMVVWLNTGRMSVVEQYELVNAYKNFFRNATSIGASAGGGAGMESRYDPPAMDSVMFFPRKTSEEASLDKIDGQSDVPDVPDIKTLLKMFYGGARVPLEYVGMGEGTGSLSDASLVTKDIRFARGVKALRKPVIEGLKELVEIELTLAGKDLETVTVEIHMSRISSIEEMQTIETLERQASIASTIADICQRLTIPNKEIVELVFQNYLKLPRNWVELSKLVMTVTGEGDDDMGGGGGGMGGMGGGGGGGSNMAAELGLPDIPDDDMGGNLDEPIPDTPEERGGRQKRSLISEAAETMRKHQSGITKKDRKVLMSKVEEIAAVQSVGSSMVGAWSKLKPSKGRMELLKAARGPNRGLFESKMAEQLGGNPVRAVCEALVAAEAHPAVRTVRKAREAKEKPSSIEKRAGV